MSSPITLQSSPATAAVLITYSVTGSRSYYMASVAFPYAIVNLDPSFSDQLRRLAQDLLLPDDDGRIIPFGELLLRWRLGAGLRALGYWEPRLSLAVAPGYSGGPRGGVPQVLEEERGRGAQGVPVVGGGVAAGGGAGPVVPMWPLQPQRSQGNSLRRSVVGIGEFPYLFLSHFLTD